MAEVIVEAAADIAKAVRARRVELDWSQEALASRMKALGVGWHQTTVAKVESTSRPRALTIQESVALAFALGVSSLDELLGNPKLSHALRANYATRAEEQFHRNIKQVRAALEHAVSTAAPGVETSKLAKALEAFDEQIASGTSAISEQYSSYVDHSAEIAESAPTSSWKERIIEELRLADDDGVDQAEADE